MHMKSFKSVLLVPLLSLGVLIPFITSSSPVFASTPQFDSGSELSLVNPYGNAQKISDIFTNKAVYGKLQGTTPVDIYSFVPNKDGSQTISLLGSKEKGTGQPILILVDPTSATSTDQLSLQMPSSVYHPYVIKQADAGKTYREPALLQTFNLYSQDHIELKKNATYYLVVVNADQSNPIIHYSIKFGDGTSWQGKDLFTNLGSWLRFHTDVYAKTSPFIFNSTVLSLVLFLLGLIVLVGTVILQETFSFLANRSKAAGYLLIKLQPFSRVMIWVSLWFLVIGGYVYFDRQGWLGIPFILALLFVVIVVNMLYYTFKISPRLTKLEVTTKREATIPLSIRKRTFFSSLISLLSLVTFLVMLSIYLNK